LPTNKERKETIKKIRDPKEMHHKKAKREPIVKHLMAMKKDGYQKLKKEPP